MKDVYYSCHYTHILMTLGTPQGQEFSADTMANPEVLQKMEAMKRGNIHHMQEDERKRYEALLQNPQ